MQDNKNHCKIENERFEDGKKEKLCFQKCKCVKLLPV